ncbi:MAG: alpha/beta-hydrolase [Monoraphidium minutum]|nr:MAG: alpha/beta-hydrolase [Monoraphidium minutum]
MSSSDLEGSEAGGGKLKMLCLHGFMQTGDSFRMRVGSLRKALKSRVAFSFLDAPFLAGDHLSAAQLAEMGGSPSGRTWFKWADMAPGKRPSQSTQYEDFDITYEAMADGLRAHAPDGIFGFSQGATAAALLLAQLQRRRSNGLDLDVPLPTFAILCAGFLPRDPVYAGLLSEERPATPALIILGESDALVPPERTLALMDTLDPAAARLLRHPGAHMVPTCSGDVKRQMVEFLDAFKPSPGDAEPGARGGGGGGGGGGAAAAEAGSGGAAAAAEEEAAVVS